MRIHAYAVYDRKTLVYQLPFFAHTDPAAVRLLSDAVADAQHPFGRHPNDYVLFRVGEWDDAKGAMLPLQALVHVVDGSSLVSALQQEIPFPTELTVHGASEFVKAPNGGDR